MTGEILTAFGNAFTSSAALALPAAFLWGVLSVVLSPCHLSSIPLVIAYMNGGTEFPTGRRALLVSTSFATGILGSIAVIGVITAAAGRMAGDVGRWGTLALAAVFLAVGLNLLGILPLPAWSTPTAGTSRRGSLGALLVLVYGLGHGAAIVAAGVSAHNVRRWLAWKNGERAARLLRGAAGLAVIAGGIYFLYTSV